MSFYGITGEKMVSFLQTESLHFLQVGKNKMKQQNPPPTAKNEKKTLKVNKKSLNWMNSYKHVTNATQSNKFEET